MTLEQQICNFVLARKLKELGIEQRSLWYWLETNKSGSVGHLHWHEDNELLKGKTRSAFTVAELGEMLPRRIIREDKKVFDLIISKAQGDFSDETRWFMEYVEMPQTTS